VKSRASSGAARHQVVCVRVAVQQHRGESLAAASDPQSYLADLDLLQGEAGEEVGHAAHRARSALSSFGRALR